VQKLSVRANLNVELEWSEQDFETKEEWEQFKKDIMDPSKRWQTVVDNKEVLIEGDLSGSLYVGPPKLEETAVDEAIQGLKDLKEKGR
jgi:hypothetical protein